MLSGIAAIGCDERKLMLEVLKRGVLPCFAGRDESVVDRLVSSTLALSFATCGLRLLDSEPDAPEAPGSSVLVTVAGLLYFSAWYVLVYASAVHTRPKALKTRLSQRGTDADGLLCSALRLVRTRGGSPIEEGDGGDGDMTCGYCVRDYRDRDIVQALLTVFKGLLDTRTVLWAAQLYVPELTAQLPYLRLLERIPDSVRGAIEGRDVWLEMLRGDQRASDSRDEPPFVYVGDVAHELHGSVRGALFKGDKRPVAAPPHSHDDHGFHPWYECLLIAHHEARCDLRGHV
ncbi:hypothetical protein F2P81_024042 [Scophthalmus maximus]|uniref:Uncharacterized protein n=1 Tax=Scophthalmus maximus TaxID=52904 RepID=A0A6A4RWD9_SCOMX|nr:hypothetical protein F2P81_024042 [Scophthalmus maximus]